MNQILERSKLRTVLVMAVLLGAGSLMPPWIAVAQTVGTQSGPAPQAEVAATPRYNVASIRTNKAGDITKRVRFVETPRALYADNVTIRLLVRDAYKVADHQIENAPKWLNTEEFNIEAKMSKTAADQLQKLSVGERRLQRQHMLQALLTDRFSLKVHWATKEGPVYALIVNKGGIKFRETKPDSLSGGKSGARMTIGGGKLTCHTCPMAPLVYQLSQQLNRTVLDKTGLTGRYDFTLHWSPDEFRLSASSGAEGGRRWGGNALPPGFSGPSIFTALKQQLGLRLKPAKGPVEVLVIDHVEPPTPN